MSFLATGLVSFFCAALSALGMGGGGLLLIYLTAYMGMEQHMAQGLNLIFFMPIAVVAIIIHAKRGLIKWGAALKCAAMGIFGVYLGWKLAMLLESDTLSRLFGLFLLITGARELFSKPKAGSGANDGK